MQLFCDSDTSECIKTQDTDYEMIHNHDGYGFQLMKISEPGKGKTVKIHLGLYIRFREKDPSPAGRRRCGTRRTRRYPLRDLLQ